MPSANSAGTSQEKGSNPNWPSSNAIPQYNAGRVMPRDRAAATGLSFKRGLQVEKDSPPGRRKLVSSYVSKSKQIVAGPSDTTMSSLKSVGTSGQDGSPFKSNWLSSNAIRQCPPACGVSHNQAAATSLKSDRALRVMRSGHLGQRDFPPGCGQQASSSVSKSKQIVAGSSGTNMSPSTSAGTSGENGSPLMSNQLSSNAIQPYPAGCGVRRHEVAAASLKSDRAMRSGVPLKRDSPPGHGKQVSSSVFKSKQIVAAPSGNPSRQERSRERIQKLLKSFNELLAQILEECDSNPEISKRNVHADAAKILDKRGRWLNVERRLGEIPGIKIGDRFQFRAELNIIGLHRQYNCGIDYMKRDGGITLATSIVATSNYANVMRSPNELVYVGEGGGPCFRSISKTSVVKDQEMTRGNLALKNSKEQGTPVRVIRHFKLERPYAYDGLFTVAAYWAEQDKMGKRVFKFLLKRVPGQPELIKEMGSKPTL